MSALNGQEFGIPGSLRISVQLKTQQRGGTAAGAADICPGTKRTKGHQ